MELPSTDFYKTSVIEDELYKKATKIVIMVSIDSYSSYEYIEKYFRKFHHLNIPFEILINKSELDSQMSEKNTQNIGRILSKIQSEGISHKFISSKTGFGI